MDAPQSESSLTVDVKILHQSIQRRFALPAKIPAWDDLAKLVKTRFQLPDPFPLGLSYKDDDGDVVTLSSDQELVSIWPKISEEDERDLDSLPPLQFSIAEIPATPTIGRDEAPFHCGGRRHHHRKGDRPDSAFNPWPTSNVEEHQDSGEPGKGTSTLREDMKAFIQAVKTNVSENKQVKDALNKVLAHSQSNSGPKNPEGGHDGDDGHAEVENQPLCLLPPCWAPTFLPVLITMDPVDPANVTDTIMGLHPIPMETADGLHTHITVHQEAVLPSSLMLGSAVLAFQEDSRIMEASIRALTTPTDTSILAIIIIVEAGFSGTASASVVQPSDVRKEGADTGTTAVLDLIPTTITVTMGSLTAGPNQKEENTIPTFREATEVADTVVVIPAESSSESDSDSEEVEDFRGGRGGLGRGGDGKRGFSSGHHGMSGPEQGGHAHGHGHGHGHERGHHRHMGHHFPGGPGHKDSMPYPPPLEGRHGGGGAGRHGHEDVQPHHRRSSHHHGRHG
ncbi:MAG: hypothetical protein CYPHOPRED_005960 [Cyphobasidiales sp. Tagirdzhanova-0007]|nr:MAG: hypothetical protein CYPHOPRED_005960 [Cyphobasidiales sp. Tagirdzhanova-0007]